MDNPYYEEKQDLYYTRDNLSILLTFITSGREDLSFRHKSSNENNIKFKINGDNFKYCLLICLKYIELPAKKYLEKLTEYLKTLQRYTFAKKRKDECEAGIKKVKQLLKKVEDLLPPLLQYSEAADQLKSDVEHQYAVYKQEMIQKHGNARAKSILS